MFQNQQIFCVIHFHLPSMLINADKELFLKISLNLQNGETVLHMLAWLASPRVLCDVLASNCSDLNIKNKVKYY